MAHMGHPYEWQNSSTSMMGTAATEQQKAADANRMSGRDIRSTSALSMNAGNSSNDALANWTATNDSLTNKMEAERAAVVQEIADLTAERAAAQLFDAAFRPGLSACELCHAIRARRPKRELILDTAAIALRDQHTDCHQSLQVLAQVVPLSSTAAVLLLGHPTATSWIGPPHLDGTAPHGTGCHRGDRIRRRVGHHGCMITAVAHQPQSTALLVWARARPQQ